jgi:hypothetical protein
MLGNQVTELQRLADNVGIAKNQRDLLVQINEGIGKTTSQIRTIQDIIERSQGVDPTSIRSLSDLNNTIEEMQYISSQTQELVLVKLFLCNQAVDQASLQSDTSYKMGQEMVSLGSQLAEESKTASPGRAEQITASAASAQTLATGVELQTMAQMSQLLALELDLHKSQMEKELRTERTKQAYMKQVLSKDKSSLTRFVHDEKKKRRKAQ